jgi:predicted tellurium resistance membrane protein TerC
VKLLGGLYLLYLSYSHFWSGKTEEERRTAPQAKPWLGMSAFWGAVVSIELVHLAFSIDSLLVAVAVSPKLWVILSGGILGIVAMRLVVGQMIALIERTGARRRRLYHHRVGCGEADRRLPARRGADRD